MNTAFIQILLKRIKSKSPAFYKKLRKYSLLAAFACGFIMTFCKINYFHWRLDIVNNIFDACKLIGAGITGVWGVTWTGTADPALLDAGNDTNTKQ